MYLPQYSLESFSYLFIRCGKWGILTETCGPTMPAGFSTWFCKLTCHPTTHASAPGMPVHHTSQLALCCMLVSHHTCWLFDMALRAHLLSHYPCWCTRYASAAPMQSPIIHTICQCTIQASWIFSACWWFTTPAGFSTWLCKLTCYSTTHASALSMPVDHQCGPWLFIPYASACNQCWTPNQTSDCYPTAP